eukprot:3934068-Rhodomonas_salina.3
MEWRVTRVWLLRMNSPGSKIRGCLTYPCPSPPSSNTQDSDRDSTGISETETMMASVGRRHPRSSSFQA